MRRVDFYFELLSPQRFRVEIAVPRCPGRCDYKVSVVSDPVLVLSKRKKKRPVKQNAETGSPAKTKKAKRSSGQGTPNRKVSSDSPDSSQSTSTTTLTITGNVTAAIAEMEETIPLRASVTTAPFAPETPNLCLWANAALDLLYKLQWQRVPTSTTEKPGANLDEILAQALSKAYKCPSCQETYGQVPMHRDDCDLKLLLEQGGECSLPTTKQGTVDVQLTVTVCEFNSGQTEASATGTAVVDLTTNDSLQWSSDKHFEWPDRSKAMYSGGDITPRIQASPCKLSQDMLQLAGPTSGQVPAKGFDFAAVTANLNISSWKDYASLSKLLYR